MKRKAIIITVSILCAALFLWGIAFVTDYIRVSSLKEPIFVVSAGVTADDGGSGFYYGAGYTVKVEKHIHAEHGATLCSVEMRMFGKVVAAAITDCGITADTQNTSSDNAVSNNDIGTDDIVDTTVSFANYCDDYRLYLSALNSDKMYISSIYHLPIFKFETLAELEQFKTAFGDVLSMNASYDEVPSFETAVSKTDDEYFEKNTVFLVYVQASSGSFRFGVDSVYCDGESLCIHIRQTNSPEVGTMDMAGWFITVSLDKSVTENLISFDADLITPPN